MNKTTVITHISVLILGLIVGLLLMRGCSGAKFEKALVDKEIIKTVTTEKVVTDTLYIPSPIVYRTIRDTINTERVEFVYLTECNDSLNKLIAEWNETNIYHIDTVGTGFSIYNRIAVKNNSLLYSNYEVTTFSKSTVTTVLRKPFQLLVGAAVEYPWGVAIVGGFKLKNDYQFQYSFSTRETHRVTFITPIKFKRK